MVAILVPLLMIVGSRGAGRGVVPARRGGVAAAAGHERIEAARSAGYRPANFPPPEAQKPRRPADRTDAMSHTFEPPPLRTTVTLFADGRDPIRGRVDFIRGPEVTLKISAQSVPPADGVPVTLRWAAGYRGRWAVTAIVLRAAEQLLWLRLVDVPAIEQVRRFTRAGGGERIWVRKPGTDVEVPGVVQDLSEQGVRARFQGKQARPGQQMLVRLELDGETLDLDGTVLESRVSDEVEIVITFEPEERDAQLIRRYVLHQQMLARSRAANA
jgi:hypothetical protein